jgi:probable HAF family extracellular repeat protein
MDFGINRVPRDRKYALLYRTQKCPRLSKFSKDYFFTRNFLERGLLFTTGESVFQRHMTSKSMEELYTMKRTFYLISFFLLATFGLSLGNANAQMSLTLIPQFLVSDVSSDGRVLTGDGTTGSGVARWTREGGLTYMNTPYSGSSKAISGDGTTVVGNAYPLNQFSQPTYQGLVWNPTGTTLIPDVPGGRDDAGANGVSYDGSIVVGYVNNSVGSESIRWTETTGAVGLGTLGGQDTNSAAKAISRDNKVIIGTSGYNYVATYNGVSVQTSSSQAFRWTAETGMVGLGDLPGDLPGNPFTVGASGSYARATSADGNVIVGTGSSSNGYEAFIWTPTTGMVGMGDLPRGGFDSAAYDVTDDGSIVVGFGNYARYNAQYDILSSPEYEAFIWSAGGGMLSLKDVLIQSGMDMRDWKLQSAIAVSGDGSTIVGYGSYKGAGSSFVLRNDSGNMMQFLQSMGLAGTASVPEPSTFLFLLFTPVVLVLRKQK